VGMCDQHEINRRKIVDFHAGVFDAFDDFEPLCPIRVDQNAMLRSLNEE